MNRHYLVISALAAYNLIRSDPRIRTDGWTWREFKNYHTASGLTLQTGAKLGWSAHCGYFIHGYHYAGQDLRPYRKYEIQLAHAPANQIN